MSRSGTTQSKIRKRRARSAKTARLNSFLRRTAIIGGVLAVMGAGASWVVINNLPQLMMSGTYKAFINASANHGFIVKNLLVEGRERTDADVLRTLLNIDRGDPILAFDPHAAREMVERISWVKSARVERRLPDTIYIELVERVPLALWQNEGKLRLIDEDGVVLTDQDLAQYKDMLLLVGMDAPEHARQIARLLASEPAIRAMTEAAIRVGERRWDLRLRGDITVKMPDHDPELALRRLAVAQEQDGLLGKDIVMIDLRDPGRMTVRTRPGAVQDYKASLESAAGRDKGDDI